MAAGPLPRTTSPLRPLRLHPVASATPWIRSAVALKACCCLRAHHWRPPWGVHRRCRQAKRDIFVSVVGLGFLCGGSVSKYSLRRFGSEGHTGVMHALSLVQYLLRAFPYEVTTWLGMLVSMVAETRMNGVGALATAEAIRCGLGKGEYSGLAANLRALMVFVAPFLWGGLYKLGVSRRPRMPGLPFVGAAAAMVLAQLALRRLRPVAEEKPKGK